MRTSGTKFGDRGTKEQRRKRHARRNYRIPYISPIHQCNAEPRCERILESRADNPSWELGKVEAAHCISSSGLGLLKNSHTVGLREPPKTLASEVEHTVSSRSITKSQKLEKDGDQQPRKAVIVRPMHSNCLDHLAILHTPAASSSSKSLFWKPARIAIGKCEVQLRRYQAVCY